MAKAKKIFLLRERRETRRVRFEKQRNFFCPSCGKETIWLNGAIAALLSGLSEREIFRLTEKGEIHFAKSDSGLMLICERSLSTFSPEQ